jgi:hypothetical protein
MYDSSAFKIPSSARSLCRPKAGYNRADHPVTFVFRLRQGGGPYLPVSPFSLPLVDILLCIIICDPSLRSSPSQGFAVKPSATAYVIGTPTCEMPMF